MIMRQRLTIFMLFFIQRLYAANLVERPPSIYEWIEENAHICTSIPSENENVLNFLTPSEGKKCSLCPETLTNKIPTSACAVEVSPNEVNVEIGCHPVPELCILELKTRFEEFFSGSKTSNPNAGSSSPQEEEIFMAAKSNPFDSNIIASLGRSSNHNPTKAQTIPQSTIFVSSTQEPVTTILTTLPSTTTTEFTTTRRPETTTTTLSAFRHGFQTTQPIVTRHQFNTFPTTTGLLEVTDDGLLEIDGDSGNGKVDSTTIRANVFSPSNGAAPVHIAGRLDKIANHVSVPITTTISPLIGNTTRSHFIGNFTTRSTLTKEVMPNELPKLNPSKSLFEKRTENQLNFQTTSTTRRFSNNSWALFRSAVPQNLTTTPLPTNFNTNNSLANEEEKECKDSNSLCCFWSISGECDSNPFWMRIHCAKTCGTCGCLLKEADQCVSTGINCTIPTTTTTTTTTTTPRPTTTTTEPTTTTTEPTPPPRFTRFTAKPRNLPRWKTKPLEINPAGAPSFRPKDDKDESSVSNQVETSVTNTTARVFISGEYAESDVKVTSSSNEFVRSPGIQGPTTPSSIENSLESKKDFSTASTSTLSTTTTPANCFNYNRLCQFWADLGECIRNPFWMRPHCQLACQSCGETLNDVFAPKAKPNCSNAHTLCPFWAFIGECARNPRWMLKNCAPSCQVC